MYQTIKESDISNTIVKELNAAVCLATFPGKGEQTADLYRCIHSVNVLVNAGGCAPIHGEYVETVKIYIN